MREQLPLTRSLLLWDTALGSFEDDAVRQIAEVVFITVIGISDKLVTFLAKRAEERFPQARLVFIDLTRPPGDILRTATARRVELFSRFADFAPSLRQPASAPEDTAKKQQVIDLTSARAAMRPD